MLEEATVELGPCMCNYSNVGRDATRLKSSAVLRCNGGFFKPSMLMFEFLVFKLGDKENQISQRVMYGKKGSTLKKA